MPTPAEVKRFQAIARRYKPMGVRAVWRDYPERYATVASAYPRGRVDPTRRVIAAPRPVTLPTLQTWLHECGHFHLGHWQVKLSLLLEEYEAERWSIDTMRREGLVIPRSLIRESKRYIYAHIKPSEPVPSRVLRWLGITRGQLPVP